MCILEIKKKSLVVSKYPTNIKFLFSLKTSLLFTKFKNVVVFLNTFRSMH